MGALDRTYPQNKSMSERRHMWRFPVQMGAALWPKQGASQQITVLDLSVDGAGLLLSKSVDAATTGVLRIEHPGIKLVLPYKVIWAQTINDRRRAGLGFYLMDSVRLQLAGLIDALVDD